MRRSGRVARLSLWLALAASTMPLGLAQSAGPAAPATLTGAVAPPTGAYAPYLAPVVLVYRLHPGYQALTAPVFGGSYRLQVPAGVYAVVETTWKSAGKRALAVPGVTVVIAGAGETVRITAARAEEAPEPDGPRVSVGRVDVLGAGDARVMVEGTLINVLAGAPCAAYAVEDAEHGNWNAILREVRLQVSKTVRPEDRRSLEDALATLRAWRATHRLTGAVTAADDVDAGRAAGTFRLVRTDTGTTVWKADLAVSSGGFDALRKRVADGVVRYLCKIPETLRVGADETVTINAATLAWRATWDLEYAGVKAYAGGLSLATYRATAVRVAFWKVSYGQACSGNGTWSGGTTAVPQGIVNLRSRRSQRTYSIDLRWTGPKIPVTVTCTSPGVEGHPATTTRQQVVHVASGDLRTSERPYPAFPIRGETTAPDAAWTVYDTTPNR